MSSLWENIRKSIREGVQLAANKTEAMTRIGKFKVEIFSIKRSIENEFTDLGGKFYHRCQEDANCLESQNTETRALLDKIQSLESKLNAKQDAMEAVSKDKPDTPAAEPVTEDASSQQDA